MVTIMEKIVKLWDWGEFSRFVDQPKHTILGLMSGTSADGLDIANVTFEFNDDNLSFYVIDAKTIPYDSSLQKRIVGTYNKERSNVEHITSFNFELARTHVDMIKSLNWRYDAISYHGQTVYHMPEVGSTLQIGEADVLAVELGRPVIYDFRKKDMVLGGQGAPISAYFDSVFLLESSECAVLNIGGISNITAYDVSGNLIAFDTGPGNCLIDLVCQRYFGKAYDESGSISSQGQIDESLLNALLYKSEPYILQAPPKSTGREIYNEEFLNLSLSASEINILRTMVRFTAETVVRNLRLHLPNVRKLIAVGGGAYNKTLISDISEMGYEVKIPERWLIDFREAIAIALLGEMFLRGVAHKQIVTGAQRTSVLGKLALPK